MSQSVLGSLSVQRRVVFQGGVVLLPAGDRGVVRAVFTEVPGKRPPGPGAGSREAGPQAVSAREPGAECTQPGGRTHSHSPHCTAAG